MTGSAPRSILLIRPSALGDVCRTVPVLARLRARFPEARIDWLVQSGFEPAIHHHPGLSRVVSFPRREMSRDLRRLRLRSYFDFRRLLREPGYDLVIDAQGLLRSAWFARTTRARARVGYANAQEFGWVFLTRRVPVPREMHTVDRMLALTEALGCQGEPDMRLYASPEDQAWAAEAEPESGTVVLAPTSRWPGKQWPDERFAALAERLLHEGVPRLVLVGARGEEAQCPRLIGLASREPRVANRIGATSIGQLMALIERSALLIANDSAAVHMGVGFGRPLVALYGPTEVGRVGPYRREGDVISHRRTGEAASHKDGSAGRALMERISVDEVFAAARARLRTSPCSSGPQP